MGDSDSPDYLDVLGAACALVADGNGVRVSIGDRAFDGLTVCVVVFSAGGYLVSLAATDVIVASGEGYGLPSAADRCEESLREYYAARIEAAVSL
jgi:hypothetical protein